MKKHRKIALFSVGISLLQKSNATGAQFYLDMYTTTKRAILKHFFFFLNKTRNFNPPSQIGPGPLY